MDGFFNYQQLQQGAEQGVSFERNSIQDEINKKLEEKKQEIFGTIEGLGDPFFVDGTQGVLKYGFNKAKKNVGERGQKLISKAEQLQKDYKDGGLKNMVKKETDRLGSDIKSRLSQKADQITSRKEAQSINDSRSRLSKLFSFEDDSKLFGLPEMPDLSRPISSVFSKTLSGLDKKPLNLPDFPDLSTAPPKINILNPFKDGDMDDDILKSIPLNPTKNDILGAIYKQDERQIRAGKLKEVKLGEDDMSGLQRKGAKIKLPDIKTDEERLSKVKEIKTNLKSQYKTLSKEDREAFKQELKDGRNNPLRLKLSNPIDQKESDIKLQQRIMNKYTSNAPSQASNDTSGVKTTPDPTQISQPSQAVKQTDEEEEDDDETSKPSLSKLKPQVDEEDEESTGKIIGKGLLKGLEEDAELGGEENPLADVVGVVVGLGSILGGIFGGHSMKAEKAKLPLPSQPSVQIGA